MKEYRAAVCIMAWLYKEEDIIFFQTLENIFKRFHIENFPPFTKEGK
jgi:hypothetical protein